VDNSCDTVPVAFSVHPSADVIERYALRHLVEEQAAPLEAHLLACSTCQRALEEIEEYVRLLRAVLLGREDA
jgi:hypothetical protein